MTATCPPGETSAALIRGGRRGAARPFDGLLSVGIARGGGEGKWASVRAFSCRTRRTRATTTSNDVVHERRTTGNSRAFDRRGCVRAKRTVIVVVAAAVTVSRSGRAPSGKFVNWPGRGGSGKWRLLLRRWENVVLKEKCVY